MKLSLNHPKQVIATAVIAIAGIAGISLISSSVFASLDAVAFNASSQQITTHTVKLTYSDNGAGFSSLIGKMVPGDTQNRYVTLDQTGTADAKDLTLQAVDANVSDLTNSNNDATRGLQLKIDECDVAWNPTTGVCSGTVTAVMAATPFYNIGTTLGAATPLTVSSLTSGSQNFLRFQVTFAGVETATNGTLPVPTVQGKTADVTWTFHENQLNGVTTNA